MNILKTSFLLLFSFIGISVFSQEEENKKEILPGDVRIAQYIHLLENKKVALLVNQSAVLNKTHLLDTLLSLGIDVKKIYAPEHGFRGNADRGAHINNSIDTKTGILIVSLFGKHRKPNKEDLEGIDIVVFDIQDAGARFFTYISTMTKAMEACAENNVEFLVLDRPNPLGDYVDGPVLDTNFRSFVGLLPIPVVHGMTVGELAQMIIGQKWINNSEKLKLEIIPIANYNHAMPWHLPIKPSPNLPTDLAIRLYPSLCFFEATKISIGRGTEIPFQILGYPDSAFGSFTFIPKDIKGMQMNPLHKNTMCYGLDLRNEPLQTKFTLKYLIYARDKWTKKTPFITNIKWFNLLAGNNVLAQQLLNGKSEAEIRQSWKKDLDSFNKLRDKYLLYPKN